jgi:ribosomal protein S6--L-glutamate ligase
VRRRPKFGKLTHRLSKGARLEKMEITEAQRRAAVETARLVGLEVAAVDMLDVEGAPKVFEVNASPALAEMEAATGVDLAGRIIERAEVLVRQARAAPAGKKGSGRKSSGRSSGELGKGPKISIGRT